MYDKALSTSVLISIHALREEGDRGTAGSIAGSPISIHALREEGDQSIPMAQKQPLYFYPRPPRGGRLQSKKSKSN